MKNEFLKFSSKRILFSAAMASALCVGSPQQAFANVNEVQAIMQAGTVKGTVVDATGEPIIGANIMVKGTTNGCITDIDGNFSLSNAKGTLVVSFIGYKSQEIAVKGNETNLKVVLAEDSEMLDEVVVVGYGTQKKATMTGSVTVVNQKMLENKGTMSSPVQALQGQVPGVIITRNSTAPGDESWNMSLRGAVSKNTTSPLVIIDGVEYESVNELRLLNPSDIESINFLKDASASIYGSKAAGGVVLVTTKKNAVGSFLTKCMYILYQAVSAISPLQFVIAFFFIVFFEQIYLNMNLLPNFVDLAGCLQKAWEIIVLPGIVTNTTPPAALLP